MPDPMERQRVRGGAGVWNPVRNCWEFTDIYWEAGFPLDLEWLSDDCFISRVEMTLWIQVSCLVRGKSGELELIERRRESSRSYILAERHCRPGPEGAWDETAEEAWVENAGTEHPVHESWDVDGEFWKSADND